MSDLLTVEEVVAILKVSRRTVYRMLADGRLPSQAIPDSKRRYIRRVDLEAALAKGGAARPTRRRGPGRV